MTIDIVAVWADIGLVLLAVVALLAVKSIILLVASFALSASTLRSPQRSRSCWRRAANLRSSSSVLRAPVALSGEMAQIASAVVGISMMVTPLCARGGAWLGRRLQRVDHRHHLPMDDAPGSSRVILVIGGYGRVGQTVARLLTAENVPFIALDTNGELVSECRKRGETRCYFGDAGRPEFLTRVGAARARAFVVTVNAREAAERMVAAARKQRPGALVFARAIDAEHAVRLLKQGAVDVIPEAVEASLQLGGRLLEGLGMSDEAVARRLDELRDQELARLVAAREQGR